MSTISLTLNEIYSLANKTLISNNCDEETANILADLIMKAERDGSISHGVFRLPAYVAGLKSGKINGKARPEIKKISQSVIKVLGNNCLAPIVLNIAIPELINAAKEKQIDAWSGILLAINSLPKLGISGSLIKPIQSGEKNKEIPKNSRLDLFYENYPRYHNERTYESVDEYFKIAQKYKISLSQLSLAFVNSRDFVTSNIIGATTMKQLKENIDSIDISLEENIMHEINLIHEKIPNPAP